MKKVMLLMGGLATILGVISFFIFDVPSKISEWYYSVHLTPKTIVVDAGDWSVTKNVQIVNNNPYPIYTVYLELSEDKPGTNIDGIEMKVDPYIVPTNFSTTTDLNSFVVSGYSKVTGKKWKRAIIYKIDAHSTVNIKVAIPPVPKQEAFRLKIKDYGKDSTPILEKDHGMMLNFDLN